MILLSTGSLHHFGIQRVFELAAGAGFRGVEVIIDPRADTWQADYLSRLSQEFGLEIRALHSPFLLSVPGWPLLTGERTERTVELAESLGVNTVVTHLPSRWPLSILITRKRRLILPHFWRSNRQEALWFEQALPFLQAESQVAIAVEIMPMFRFLGWPLNAHRWNNLAEWSRFEHLTLDTTHCGTWRIDPRLAYDRAQGKVRHIHISNFDGREHVLPQRGRLALDRFLRHIVTEGYQGDITIETSPEAMGTEETVVRKNLAESLAFCREHSGQT